MCVLCRCGVCACTVPVGELGLAQKSAGESWCDPRKLFMLKMECYAMQLGTLGGCKKF